MISRVGGEKQTTPIVMGAMWLLGILGFAVIALVLLGWLPFGERANISRRDINLIEWIIVMSAFLYGAASFHAGSGLLQGKQEGIRWGQWVAFATLFLGGAIIMSVVIPATLKHVLLNAEGINLATVLDGSVDSIGSSQRFLVFPADSLGNLGGILTTVGLLGIAVTAMLALASFVLPGLNVITHFLTEGAYSRRFLRLLMLTLILGVILMLIAGSYVVNSFPEAIGKIRHPAYQHLFAGVIFLVVGWFSYVALAQDEEESDELRRAVSLSPAKTIRTQLAKSPSAGAIIGAMAIFFFFAVASDLFLEQSSVASFLSNISTKGIIAIGVTLLMISGEFDLSIGSILGVAALSFLAFMTDGAPLLGVLQPLEAAILTLFVVAVLGGINGTLLIFTRIPSFIVTLGTMLAFRAVTLVAIAGGRILRYSDYHEFLPVVTIPGIVFVALAVIGILLLLYSAYRSLPVMWRRLQESATQLRANVGVDAGPNEAFRSVDVFFRALSLLVVAVVILVFLGWLVIVIGYHLSDQGSEVEVGFFDITNGRLINHCAVDPALIETGEAVMQGRERLGEGECSVERIVAGEEVRYRGMMHPVGAIVSDDLVGWDVNTRANFRLSIIWWLFFVIVFHLLLTRTTYGNRVFAVGGNPGAARAQGVNVDRVKMRNFIILALLTGIAGIYEVARNPGVDPLKGEGWELEVIAMTVIGGTLLSGGYGSIIGSMLGALIVGMLQTGLVLVGIPSRLFAGTVGVTIIVAVVMNTFVRGGAQD
ncbi:MAG: ABC transporter permease [Anaerolineaceae bacterium]|nr:ABC transporter permease [Anaerolineaceae bacterium]MCY3936160.1 ABC transporter permease [Chloroflexota bacterium]